MRWCIALGIIVVLFASPVVAAADTNLAATRCLLVLGNFDSGSEEEIEAVAS